MRHWGARVFAVLVVAAAVGGCTDGATAPEAVLERITLGVVPGSPAAPTEETVQRFELGAEQDAWEPEAPESVWLRPRWGEGAGLKVLRLTAADRKGALLATRAGSYDPARFNEVRVLAASGAPGSLVVDFTRAGELVGRTLRRELVISTTPQIVRLPLPPEHSDGRVFDALVLRFAGTSHRVSIAAVELVQVPVEAALPDPEAGPDMVAVVGDARRGVCVTTARPVTAELDVPPGARLSFSYTQPLIARREGAGADLLVTLSDESGAEETHVYSFTRQGEMPRWHDVELRLDRFAGGRAQVRFDCRAADGGVSACVVGEASLWSDTSRPPTVLLVTSDTHRADHLGLAEPAVDVRTPTLDALGRRGVTFLRAFSSTNVTNPSHVALLTGAHPRDTGIVHNNVPLTDAATTLAERYAEAGYVTWAALSARHLGHPTSGLGQGFDRMSWPADDGERRAEETLAVLEPWLDTLGERPLFLWLHLFDAHGPYHPPGVWRRQYYPPGKDAFDPSLPETGIPDDALPDHYAGLRDLEFPLAAYKAEVSYLDAELARVLGRPRFRNGIVAVTADHGESLGQHGIYYAHAGLFPDTIHVPLVLAWPDAPAGRRVPGAVSHLDLGRTLLELSGLPGDDFPGRNLVERLDADPTQPVFTLSAHRFSAAVTWNDLHLILQLRDQKQRQMMTAFERHAVRLYDLSADPECLHDLSPTRHADAADLRARLIDWLEAAQDLGWSGTEGDDPEIRAQLAQLGYVAPVAEAGESFWEADDCSHCRAFSSDAR